MLEPKSRIGKTQTRNPALAAFFDGQPGPLRWRVAAATAVCAGGLCACEVAPRGVVRATTPEVSSQPPAAVDPAACASTPLVPQRLWRLSNAQYGNTVRDLLGLGEAPRVTGGGQSAFSFYSADTEGVSDALAFNYSAAAEAAAAAADVERVAACAAGEAPDDCALRFIRTLLPRAFRRPATDLEVGELLGVYHAGLPEGHAGGLRLMVEAVLNSPSLIYRREFGTPTGGDRADLTGYEVAAELSYLLLDSGPDAALVAAADNGALSAAAGIQEQIERLLTLPQAQANVTRVVLDWFGAPQVVSKSKTEPGFDLLRVASFMWSPGTNHVVFGELFDGMKTGEHHPPSHSTDPEVLRTLAAIDAWYSARTCEALQAFDQLLDVDGASLLSNTVVPYVTEIGRAYDHDFQNSPVAIFGGGARIPGGRFLDFSAQHHPTNDVWLALAPLFGVSLSSLGAAEQSTGPLPGLVV